MHKFLIPVEKKHSTNHKNYKNIAVRFTNPHNGRNVRIYNKIVRMLMTAVWMNNK